MKAVVSITTMNDKLSVGEKVVFENRIHQIVSIFPVGSCFYGKLLLNWVKNPKPVGEVIPFDEQLHKHLPAATDITD